MSTRPNECGSCGMDHPSAERCRERFPEGHSRTITGVGLRGASLQLSVGDRIRFLRSDGVIRIDTVRTCFHAFVLLAPYAENYSEPAVVLTEHSWTRVANVIEVLPCATA